MNSNSIFLTGIGTGVGKTVVSAVLCEAFGCTYWKPIQAGDLNDSDSLKIRSLSKKTKIVPEKFKLKTAASPHLAAKIDGIEICEKDLQIPDNQDLLLIEGAGGLMVPINEKGLIYADVLKLWQVPIVLVSRHYLGSINHTILSLEYIKNANLEIKILIWVGDENKSSEEIIKQRYPELCTYRIPLSQEINEEFIKSESKKIDFRLFEMPSITLRK